MNKGLLEVKGNIQKIESITYRNKHKTVIIHLPITHCMGHDKNGKPYYESIVIKLSISQNSEVFGQIEELMEGDFIEVEGQEICGQYRKNKLSYKGLMIRPTQIQNFI